MTTSFCHIMYPTVTRPVSCQHNNYNLIMIPQRNNIIFNLNYVTEQVLYTDSTLC